MCHRKGDVCVCRQPNAFCAQAQRIERVDKRSRETVQGIGDFTHQNSNVRKQTLIQSNEILSVARRRFCSRANVVRQFQLSLFWASYRVCRVNDLSGANFQTGDRTFVRRDQASVWLAWIAWNFSESVKIDPPFAIWHGEQLTPGQGTNPINCQGGPRNKENQETHETKRIERNTFVCRDDGSWAPPQIRFVRQQTCIWGNQTSFFGNGQEVRGGHTHSCGDAPIPSPVGSDRQGEIAPHTIKLGKGTQFKPGARFNLQDDSRIEVHQNACPPGVAQVRHISSRNFRQPGAGLHSVRANRRSWRCHRSLRVTFQP